MDSKPEIKDDACIQKIDSLGRLPRSALQTSLSAIEEIAALDRTEDARMRKGGEKEVDEGDVVAEGEET